MENRDFNVGTKIEIEVVLNGFIVSSYISTPGQPCIPTKILFTEFYRMVQYLESNVFQPELTKEAKAAIEKEEEERNSTRCRCPDGIDCHLSK